jgi:salicylate hydroxylase
MTQRRGSITDPNVTRYQLRDSQKAGIQRIRQTSHDNFDNTLRSRMSEVGLAGKRPQGYLDWIYKNDTFKVWEDYLAAEKREDVS